MDKELPELIEEFAARIEAESLDKDENYPLKAFFLFIALGGSGMLSISEADDIAPNMMEITINTNNPLMPDYMERFARRDGVQVDTGETHDGGFRRLQIRTHDGGARMVFLFKPEEVAHG